MVKKTKNYKKVNKRPTINNTFDIDAQETIMPNSSRQLEFINSTAFECFYAGGAGAGKTFALLLAAARYYEDPHYRAVLFRNTMPEVTAVLREQSNKIYPLLGGIYNHRENVWKFPSGAQIRLTYMRDNKDILKHLGTEYQFIGFDELVTFDEDQFTKLILRLRSSRSAVPCQIRATSNPYKDWVFYRYYHWLNHPHTECVLMEQAGTGSCPFSGKKLDLSPDGASSGIITQVIMGKTGDNKDLINMTPHYEDTLKSGNKLEVAYYYYNDWTVKPSQGLYFKRDLMPQIDALPINFNKLIRSWDLASTINGDYTVGILMAQCDDKYYILDMKRERLTPDLVEKLILDTAKEDYDNFGHKVRISIPKDSPIVEANYSKLLAGFSFEFRSERIHKSTTNTNAKEVRAQPLSAQVLSKNVFVKRNALWNSDFYEELEDFPLGKHDDIVDACSGAFNALIGNVYLKYSNFKNAIRRMF